MSFFPGNPLTKNVPFAQGHADLYELLVLSPLVLLPSFAPFLPSAQEKCSVLSNPCLYWP